MNSKNEGHDCKESLWLGCAVSALAVLGAVVSIVIFVLARDPRFLPITLVFVVIAAAMCTCARRIRFK